ncbi:MAG: methyl-accepting chemotaxis protein [Shimia sp.]
MTMPSPTAFRRLSTETFQAVGPARIAAFVIYVIRPSDLSDATRYTVAEGAVDRVIIADKMLGETFPQGCAALGLALPPGLETKRREAREVLAPLVGVVQRGRRDFSATVGGDEVLRRMCLDKIEPVLTGFLHEMLSVLREAEERAAHEEMESARAAISQVSTVSRSIRMIAINAGIEAARAGEAGASFKVIATEIKGLATKTDSLLSGISKAITD